MSKMLVVVFDEENKAYEGSRALTRLHGEGSITVYAGAVIGRNADGGVSVMDDADEGPIGTALGMMTGALIGILAGPQGVAIGAAAGGMLGSIGDMVNLGVGSDFLDEVGQNLAPGKFALVAEVAENWVTPIDTAMGALGGTVMRRYRSDVEDDQINRDINAFKTEYQELKAEIKTTNDENKAKLQAKMDATKAKLAASRDRAAAKIDEVQAEGDAKVKAVEQQINKASADTKAKLNERAEEIKASTNTRKGKLKQSWELAKEALT